jgi:hypothetical protein
MFIGPCIVIYSYNKANKMHPFLKLFILVKHCMFRTIFPSIIRSSRLHIQQQASAASSTEQQLFYICLLLNVQSWAPDDGRKDRPKHVECFTRTNNLRNRCILLVLLYECYLLSIKYTTCPVWVQDSHQLYDVSHLKKLIE